MNPRVALFSFVLTSAVFSGCASTPESRISDHRATFSALSVDEQAKIRAGQVEIGFTPEMVQMALGDPDRRYTRTTAQGTSEVWAYRSHAPRFSLGIGVGGGHGSTGVGAGVGVGTGGDQREDKLRVIFAQDRVASIERAGAR